MKNVVVFTGAGISAESGIKTFRDAGGLWEGHDVMSVASPEGFRRNPGLVLDFYNQRRAQLAEVSPNPGHLALVELESEYGVTIITQNVDDLHERAGSRKVIHLHGELKKMRSTGNPNYINEIEGDINLGDYCPEGFQLRPHIVWFGEAVPMIAPAITIVERADIMIVVGSSLQVYPAASLLEFAPAHCQIYYIDPKPYYSPEVQARPVEIIAQKSSIGVPNLVNRLKKR